MPTKKELKTDLASLLKSSRIGQTFSEHSEAYAAALSLTSHMNIVYGQRDDQHTFVEFRVLEVTSRKFPSFLCLHVLKKDVSKWVPLTSTMIFRPAGGSNSNHKRRVLAALRLIIKPQITAFKSSLKFPIECPLTGVMLTSADSATTHIDHHHLPFSHLVNVFLARMDIDIKLIALNRQGLIKNTQLTSDWYQFHLENADLAIVDRVANLKKGAKLISCKAWLFVIR